MGELLSELGDFEPEPFEHGELLVPEEFPSEDEARRWAELATYVYGDRGYQTSVSASRYLFSKLNKSGEVLPSQFGLVEFMGGYNDPDEHEFFGVLKGVLIEPTIDRVTQFGPRRPYVPFAVLEFAYDASAQEPLGTKAGQFIKVPLWMPSTLMLDLNVRVQNFEENKQTL